MTQTTKQPNRRATTNWHSLMRPKIKIVQDLDDNPAKKQAEGAKG